MATVKRTKKTCGQTFKSLTNLAEVWLKFAWLSGHHIHYNGTHWTPARQVELDFNCNFTSPRLIVNTSRVTALSQLTFLNICPANCKILHSFYKSINQLNSVTSHQTNLYWNLYGSLTAAPGQTRASFCKRIYQTKAPVARREKHRVFIGNPIVFWQSE